jgi:predicted phosphodiesterase
MRIALISDIHGHGIALEAVLADLHQQHVDSIICLGDVATIGPQPKQILAKLKAIGCICLLGNHDAALLHMEQALAYHIAPSLLPTLQWCAQQLAPAELEYLQSFIPVFDVPLGSDAALRCFHGSPHSNTDLILPTTPGEELNQLLAGETATVLAGGHSHIQMLRQHMGKLIVNPGSVGNAFLRPPMAGAVPTLLPWAEYALVTWAKGVLSVDLRRVPFDLAAFSEVIAVSDIPIRSWWLQQYAPTHTNST